MSNTLAQLVLSEVAKVVNMIQGEGGFGKIKSEIEITQTRLWRDMNFGTKKNPRCGICGDRDVVAYYKKGTLQEDVICDDCADSWKYIRNTGYYVREHKATVLSANLSGNLKEPDAEDIEENIYEVEECYIDGKIYVRDYYDNIYDNETEDEVGKYDFVQMKWISQVAF